MAAKIVVHSKSVTYSVRGRVERKETFLDSMTLLASLYSIKEAAVEPHTRNNLQLLIDAILELNPSQ